MTIQNIIISIFLISIVTFILSTIRHFSARKLGRSMDEIENQLLAIEDASHLNRIASDSNNDNYPLLKQYHNNTIDIINTIIRKTKITMVISCMTAIFSLACIPFDFITQDSETAQGLPSQIIAFASHDDSPDKDTIITKPETPDQDEVVDIAPAEPKINLFYWRDTVNQYIASEIAEQSHFPVEQSFIYTKGIRPCQEKALYCDRLVQGDLIITIHDYEESIKSLFIMMYNHFEKGWGETLDRYFLDQFNNQDYFNALCNASAQCLAIDRSGTDQDTLGINDDNKRKLKMMWYLHLINLSILKIHHNIQIEHDGTDTIILNWRDYMKQAEKYYPGNITQFEANRQINGLGPRG